MSADRDSTQNRPMTREELDEQLGSLRTVGGVYDYVAACVEYDNRDALAPEEGLNRCSPN